MSDEAHLHLRDEDYTLCDVLANIWMNRLIDEPVEDLCPQCLDKLIVYLQSAKEKSKAAHVG